MKKILGLDLGTNSIFNLILKIQEKNSSTKRRA
jgi:cell division ATPase FtsA